MPKMAYYPLTSKIPKMAQRRHCRKIPKMAHYLPHHLDLIPPPRGENCAIDSPDPKDAVMSSTYQRPLRKFYPKI